MMTVAVHARWSGQATRAAAVRQFIEYALERPGVRFMRREDIARGHLPPRLCLARDRDAVDPRAELVAGAGDVEVGAAEDQRGPDRDPSC